MCCRKLRRHIYSWLCPVSFVSFPSQQQPIPVSHITDITWNELTETAKYKFMLLFKLDCSGHAIKH